jgi:hypothetical protein
MTRQLKNLDVNYFINEMPGILCITKMEKKNGMTLQTSIHIPIDSEEKGSAEQTFNKYFEQWQRQN